MNEYNTNSNYLLEQKQPVPRYIPTVGLVATLCLGTILNTYATGDGSNEPGFVAPPKDRALPSAPPRTISSAENTDPCCCCPVTPQARSEAKRPPQPPSLITKLKD
jgi:hypothetical protein